MPARSVLLAVLVTVGWGLNFVVIDVGLETFPPILFAALRFLVVLLPAVFLLPRPRVPVRWLVGVGVFTMCGQFALLFSAMEVGMPAGLASLVLQLQTVFTIGFGVAVLGERPSARVVAGCGVALAGMAVIAVGRGGHVPLGALGLSVAAAAAWGAGNVCTRRAQADNAMALMVWGSLVALPLLTGLSLALEGPAAIGDALAGIDAPGVLALLYVVVVSTFFGYTVWGMLLRDHPVALVAPFTLLVPPVGIVSAWLLLGEVPTLPEVAGALVVLLGLALTTGLLSRRARRRSPAAATPPAGRVASSP